MDTSKEGVRHECAEHPTPCLAAEMCSSAYRDIKNSQPLGTARGWGLEVLWVASPLQLREPLRRDAVAGGGQVLFVTGTK